MNTNLYHNLMNTCNRLKNTFDGISHVQLDARPVIDNDNGNLKDISIKMNLYIELKDDKMADAEKIAGNIRKIITD